MSTYSRKKKIRITLEARNTEDARRILRTVEEACKAASVAPDAAAPVSTVRPADFALEQLETEVNAHVGANLDRKHEVEKKKQVADGKPDGERSTDAPAEIITKRAKLVGFCKGLGALTYRLTVKVMADFVKEMSGPT